MAKEIKTDKIQLNIEMKKSIEQGRMTEKLGKMLIVMSESWNLGFQRKNNLDDYTYSECVSASLERLCKEYMNFNFEKYDNCFAYLTALIIRGAQIGIHNCNHTNYYLNKKKLTPKFTNIDDCKNL